MFKTPAWERKEGKDPAGGLNAKGRASAKAEGHNLKPPAPNPKNPQDKARKKSYCARAEGMKAKLTSAETANDPDSRINKSLRAWNCADGGAVDPYDSVQQAAKGGQIWDKPRPKKLGKPEPLSSKEKASAKAAAKAAGRPYPNLIDNMRAARADGGELTGSDIDPYDDVQRAAGMGATPAVPPVSVTEHAVPSTPALDAYRGAINEAIPLPARALASGMMGVHSPMTEKDLSPSDRQEIIRQTENQRAKNAEDEANLAQEYAYMTPERYQHQVNLEVRDPLPYEMYKNQTLRDLESFERTRGKNSVFYDESLLAKDPHGDRGRGINVYNPENNGALRAAQLSYSSPAYRVGMTLGRYNVYDTPQGRIVADNYDFNRDPVQPRKEIGLSDYYKGFMPALRQQINTSFPNINRPVAMNLDAKPNTSYSYTGQPFTTPGSNVHRLATRTLDQDAIVSQMPGMLSTGQTPGDTKSDVTPRLSFMDRDTAAVIASDRDKNPPLPPRRPTSFADGGAVDDRAHDFVQEQLKSGEPQVPQYVAENDFPARAARGVEAVDTAASRVNNMLANVAGQPAMRSPEGRSASEIVQSAMPVDPYQAVQQAAGQWREGDKLGAVETMAAGMPMQGAIRAYHGGPHVFDRFDISKVGTGEGAQMYGHGLYFAENPAVAQEYRSRLAGRPEIKSLSIAGHRVGPSNNFDYSPRTSGNYENLRSSLFEDMLLDEDALVADPKSAQQLAISKLTQRIKDLTNEWPEALPDAQRLLKDISRPSGVGLRLGETPGAMYEVDIHSKPEHFLDWDRSLDEQSPYIQNVLGKITDASEKDKRSVVGSDYYTTDPASFSGESIYQYLSEQNSPKNASRIFKSLGVPGIRYADQFSRNEIRGNPATSNYVVFDPRNIEILRRYADGGEVIGDKVQGDVQFLEDDPYAKVQEAAKLPMMARDDFAMRMPQQEVKYDTGPQPGEATLKGYDPTIKERIYQGIAGTEERPSPERAQFARGMSQMAEFAPVLGNVMAGQEAQRRGDTKGMLMAALPVPGAATEASAVSQAAKRALNPMGMYSHAAEAAAALPQAKGSYEQMMGMLQRMGVKPEEMHWSGVQQFAGQPVTREQLATHFHENLPQIKETVYAAPDESKLDAADAEVRRILQAHNEANNPETYQPRYYGITKDPAYATPFFDTEEEARAAMMAMPERFRANMQILPSQPKPQVDIYETMRRLHGGEYLYNLPDAAQRPALNLLDERTALEKAAEESAPKFGEYTIPGGKNYREVLLHTPGVDKKSSQAVADYAKQMSDKYGERWSDRMSVGENYRYSDLMQAQERAESQNAYKSGHWDQPNVLAHLRMSDRTGPQGEKILHLEELQSDWGQAGRKQGFKPELTREQEAALRDERNKQTEIAYNQTGGRFDQSNPQYMQAMDRITEINKLLGEGTVPKSPYVSSPEGKHTSSWVDLGLKRALREAAEKGYDKLVWTPGAEQAARYDLSKQIDRLVYNPDLEILMAYKDGEQIINRSVAKNELDSAVGKDVAKNLLSSEGQTLPGAGSAKYHILEGQDLSVGGEGMKGFYDKILPTQLQKIVKKLDPDAKVQMGGHEVSTGKYQVFAPNGKMIAEYPHMESAQAIVNRIPGSTMAPVGGINAHSITITPKMREAILGGLPAYADGGAVDDAPKQDPYEAVQQAANTQKEYKPFNVLPLREDEAGIHFDPNAGVLGGMKRAGEYFYDTMSGRKEMDPTSSEAIEAASNIAGMTTLGAGAFERPAGSLAMGASRVKESLPSLYSKENDLLNSIGRSKMVGSEELLFDDGPYKAGISSFPMNNKKSIRYLHHDEEGNPIGVLQIMTHGPRSKKATIQNVYVAEDYRRKKIASDLLKRARQDYDVKHSTDLTDQGRAFAKAVKSSGGKVVNKSDPYDNIQEAAKISPRARRDSH